jgi:hypothetical protein
MLPFAEQRVAVLFILELLAGRLIRLRDCSGGLSEVRCLGNGKRLLKGLVARQDHPGFDLHTGWSLRRRAVDVFVGAQQHCERAGIVRSQRFGG